MISCIVTTYKRPISTLKRALDSIVNQTYKDIEMILVNDAPEDQAGVKAIEDFINCYHIPKQYIVHERNMGACAARNTGLAHANGEYVAFLDDDDEWLPEKLKIQLEVMENESAALVYCSHYIVDGKGRERLIVEPLAREGVHSDEFERLLCSNFVGSTSYPLMKTQAVKAVGGFTVGLKASQDHDLWLRIAKEYQIVYCNMPLVKLYYSDESISRSVGNNLQGFEYLLNSYLWFYKENPWIWNYRLNYLACCCVKLGAYKQFLKYWGKAISVRPMSRNNFMLFTMVIRKIRKR